MRPWRHCDTVAKKSPVSFMPVFRINRNGRVPGTSPPVCGVGASVRLLSRRDLLRAKQPDRTWASAYRAPFISNTKLKESSEIIIYSSCSGLISRSPFRCCRRLIQEHQPPRRVIRDTHSLTPGGILLYRTIRQCTISRRARALPILSG